MDMGDKAISEKRLSHDRRGELGSMNEILSNILF